MTKTARRGQIILIVVIALIVLAAAGAVGLTLRNGGGSDGRSDGRPDSFTVHRGEFEIMIPVSGELVAMRQVEIRNQLDNEAIITEIIPEGQWVKPGDVLLRLNEDELRNEVRDGVDEVNVAQAEVVRAKADLDIAVKERESELAKADVAIELATLALKGWEEGEDKSKRRELAIARETAQKNTDRLEARFKESATLLEKKFISLDEYKQDEIALIEARATLEQADLAINLYENYQFFQEKAQKESDLQQAQAERGRVDQSTDAEVRSAQSDMDSKTYQLESKRERLRLAEQQLSYCTVRAPSEGMVVYQSSLESSNWGGRGGGDDGAPQVGTQLYPNQVVIVLPDTSQMVASVKVSESLSGEIKKGQPATVTCDARPDLVMQGEVERVGVLAEGGGWRDPNRRDYTVRILLRDGNKLSLKPSMRCKANINVGRVRNALHVPIHAVFHNSSLTYVYVPDRSGYSQRKITPGRSSELFMEVIEGLTEGETVLLREPEQSEIVSRLPVPKDDRRRDDDEETEDDEQADQPVVQPAVPPGIPPNIPQVRPEDSNAKPEKPGDDSDKDKGESKHDAHQASPAPAGGPPRD